MQIPTTKEQLIELRAIFNEVDPVCIYYDENHDEYDPEIRALLEECLKLTDEELVLKTLKIVFSSYFEGLILSEEKMSVLAKKLVLFARGEADKPPASGSGSRKS